MPLKKAEKARKPRLSKGIRTLAEPSPTAPANDPASVVETTAARPQYEIESVEVISAPPAPPEIVERVVEVEKFIVDGRLDKLEGVLQAWANRLSAGLTADDVSGLKTGRLILAQIRAVLEG